MENKELDKKYDDEQSKYITQIRKAISSVELSHASLSRIYHHFIHSQRSSFAIITYYQTDLSGDEKSEGNHSDSQGRNKEARKKFLAMLRDLKLGFFKLIGHFIKEEEDYETEKVTTLREPCFFISGISMEQAKKLMKEFCQKGFVYSGPESEGKLWLVTEKDREKHGMEGELDVFEPSTVAEFYSAIKGHKIIFEGIPWSVHEGIFTQPLSSCTKIPGIKRWQEINAEGGDAFFRR